MALRTFSMVIIFAELSLCQFLFDNYEPPCSFRGEEGTIQFKAGILYDFTAANGQLQFLITPCNPSASKAVIIMRKGNRRINAGKKFAYVADDEGTFVLKSTGGDLCQNAKNKTYSIELVLECGTTMKLKPNLLTEDGCTYKISIPHPNCDKLPNCIKQINGHLIDFKPFYNKQLTFPSKDGKKTIYISLCGKARRCGDGNSACEIQNGVVKILGDIKSRQMLFDEREKKIYIRMQAGVGRYKQTNQVDVLCNFNSENLFSNLTVIKDNGLNYKFSVESKYGCIKLPMECAFVKDSISYNLFKLNKKDNWKSNNGLSMNICGRMKNENQQCSRTHAQVCYNSKNYGSILTDFRVDDKHTIFMQFSHGDVCPTNATFKLSTNIEMRCAFQEKGPVIKSNKDCKLNIDWYTPSACPVEVSEGNNCVVNDRTGKRSLSALQQSTDRIFSINNNAQLRYSLCGRLAKPCNEEVDVSACLHLNGKEIVIGYYNTGVKMNNGEVYMEFEGETCDANNSPRKLRVNFFCTYRSQMQIKSQVILPNCVYQLNITTPHACPDVKTADCKLKHGNKVIDLTPLMPLNKNYKIMSKVRNMEFELSICKPIIPTTTSFCFQNTAICLRNISEPNPVNRFISLGKISNLLMENNELKMSFKQGTFDENCAQDMESTIKFQCGQTDGKPELAYENPCSFTFLWKTKLACLPQSIIKHCLINDKYNFDLLENRTIKLNENLTLNICTKEAFGKETLIISNLTEIEKEETSHEFIYTIPKLCNEKDYVVKLYGHCSEGSPQLNYSKTSMEEGEECYFHYNLTSPIFCSKKEEKTPETNINNQSVIDINQIIEQIHAQTEANLYLHINEEKLSIKTPPPLKSSPPYITIFTALTVVVIVCFIMVYYWRRVCWKTCFKKRNTLIYSRDMEL